MLRNTCHFIIWVLYEFGTNQFVVNFFLLISAHPWKVMSIFSIYGLIEIALERLKSHDKQNLTYLVKNFKSILTFFFLF
jgi:hypothetical protein